VIHVHLFFGKFGRWDQKVSTSAGFNRLSPDGVSPLDNVHRQASRRAQHCGTFQALGNDASLPGGQASHAGRYPAVVGRLAGDQNDRRLALVDDQRLAPATKVDTM
jgi:hypothetical protein